MKILTSDEMITVFGGDNPAMGPYAPPFTQDLQNQYMNAFKPLLGTMGPLGGLVESRMVSDLQRRAEQYNLLNGYNRDGTQYQFPSGVYPATISTFDVFIESLNSVQVDGSSGGAGGIAYQQAVHNWLDSNWGASNGGAGPGAGGPNYNGPSGFFPSQ